MTAVKTLFGAAILYVHVCCLTVEGFEVHHGAFYSRRHDKLLLTKPDRMVTPILKHGRRNMSHSTGLFMIWGSDRNVDEKKSDELDFDTEDRQSPLSRLRTVIGMPDNTQYLDEAKTEFMEEVKTSEQGTSGQLKAAFLLSSVAVISYAFSGQHDSFPMNILFTAQNLLANPSETLEGIVSQVESMGNLGFLYFGAFYTIAEILAIPAIPLTASAGYLFGVQAGSAVVLLSASIAASISFIIGRTILRPYVEGLLEKYPKFKALDRIIGKEGFKLILLLRLSPLFPFALSNYLYGVTSVDFLSYFWGTLFGFLPGTVAYVYTGEIGKVLTVGAGEAQPWYVYAGALGILAGTISILGNIASKVIAEIEEEDIDTK